LQAFCVILFAEKQTNNWTDIGNYITSLGRQQALLQSQINATKKIRSKQQAGKPSTCSLVQL